MDRREAIKTTSMIMGFTLSGAAFSAVMSGCKADTSTVWKPKSFDINSDIFLSELSDFILPRTNTPGAKDVYVNRFIDQVVTDYFDDEGKFSGSSVAAYHEGKLLIGTTTEKKLLVCEYNEGSRKLRVR